MPFKKRKFEKMQQMRPRQLLQAVGSFCHEECFWPPTKYGQWRV